MSFNYLMAFVMYSALTFQLRLNRYENIQDFGL